MNHLKGELVYLRALEPDDAELLYTWENDTSIWHLGNTLAPYSKHLLKQFVENLPDIYSSKQLRLMICLYDNTPIGAIDLFDFAPRHQRAGIGILIADNKLRNKGYGSESLKLVINYAFETLHLKQLFCNVLEDNEKSLKLFKSHNFMICGTKRSWLKINNEWKNEHMLQLIAENV